MKVFNSQICTSREQGERLLSLGLKPETADCALFLNGNNEFEQLSKFGNWEKYADMLPAWSLHRLIEMMPKSIHFKNEDWYKIIYNNSVCYQRGQFSICRSCKGDLYEDIANCIEWLIKEGYFNREYLV